MSEYFFGLGLGHLGKKAAKIAAEYGASLVNYNDEGCRCGNGCAYDCPATARHWFTGPNRGEPHDSKLARAVLDALQRAGLIDEDGRIECTEIESKREARDQCRQRTD